MRSVLVHLPDRLQVCRRLHKVVDSADVSAKIRGWRTVLSSCCNCHRSSDHDRRRCVHDTIHIRVQPHTPDLGSISAGNVLSTVTVLVCVRDLQQSLRRLAHHYAFACDQAVADEDER